MSFLQPQQNADFYVVGGTLRHDAPSYISRRADQELFERLRRGQFCYALTARQMGKSSLMIRTAARLRSSSIAVAVLDLTAVGQNVSAEQWYCGLLLQLGQRLDLEDELIEFWQSRPLLGLLQRWLKAIREVVVPHCHCQLVIFIDEIDTVRSLPFSTDEFFAGLRESSNQSGEDAAMDLLTFCLLRVATPAELILDKRITPFNIGHCIELNDFSEKEATLLMAGMRREPKSGAALLKRILYWTGGHPYLTQKLCQSVASDLSICDQDDLDRLCDDLFFTSKARERDDNLLFVREQLLRSDTDRANLLVLYQKIRRGKRVQDDEANPLTSTLRLSCITREENGWLKVRNRIYERVFDEQWVLENMPEAELRRQRAAYRQGLWRAATISGVILVLVGSLALLAFKQSRRATAQAEVNRQLLYYAQMRLAQEEWENANIDRVDELLQSTVPQPGQADLRGFEWYEMWQLTHSYVWRTKEKYQVTAVAFASEGLQLGVGQWHKALRSGFNEYIIKLYDLQHDKEQSSFTAPCGTNFSNILFSPDLKQVVLDGADYVVSLRDMKSGQQLRMFKGHQAPLLVIASTPAWDKLVTSDVTGVMKIWEMNTGKERVTLKLPRWVRRAAFSPDGRWLVATDETRQARIWDTATGQELPPIVSDIEVFTNASFFPDSRRLLIATLDGSVQVWGLHPKRILATLAGHSGYIQAVAFAPEGKTFATANYDRTVKLWSGTTYRNIATIKGHGSAVLAVAWTPDGRRLVTSSADTSIKMWDTTVRQEPVLPAEKVTSFKAAAFTESQELLALATTLDKQLKLYNLSSGHEVARLSEESDNVLYAAFSPNRKLLATTGMDKLVKLWNVTTGKMIAALSGHTDFVYSAEFSPDGALLVTGGKDRKLKVWDAVTGKILASLQGESDNSYRAVFSPDGKQIASACRDGSVLLWEWPSTQIVAVFRGHGSTVRALAFSPDGRLLATGGEDNSIRLWDIQARKALSNLGQADSTQRITFSPDGRRLLTGSMNGSLKLWDLGMNRELMTLRGHREDVTAISFSFDGTRLVSCASDGTLRVRNAASTKTVLEASDLTAGQRLEKLIPTN